MKMKKGPAILVLVGLALLSFLYFLPVTPPENSGLKPEANTEATSDDDALSPDEKVEVALQKLQSGELPPMQAILQIRAVADEHPENVKANFTLGVMSIQTGQYDKAIGRFEKVLEQEPENSEAHRLMATAALQLGDTTHAVEHLEKAGETVTPEMQAGIEQQLKELRVNK
mgnify:CR=1 FL=1